MATKCNASLKRVKWLQIILSAITTGGAIGVVFNESSVLLPYVTAFFSVITLIVNSYMKDIDPGASAQKHREAASDLWNSREGYLSLLADIRDRNISIDDLRVRRDKLQDHLHVIYKNSPHTDDSAYKKAQNALKNKEDLYFSDEELDKLLPAALRRKNAE